MVVLPQLNIKDQQDISEHQGFNTRAFKDGDFKCPSLDDYHDWFNPNTSYRSSEVYTRRKLFQLSPLSEVVTDVAIGFHYGSNPFTWLRATRVLSIKERHSKMTLAENEFEDNKRKKRKELELRQLT
uniref:Uncharacterized protein n=1 Tax=Tanacetum cinerariifolium TaxID=118510 RepID=A0A699GSI8_TANCI|nr:hypothetical protein [Tanacetum cinerariifolium]